MSRNNDVTLKTGPVSLACKDIRHAERLIRLNNWSYSWGQVVCDILRSKKDPELKSCVDELRKILKL